MAKRIVVLMLSLALASCTTAPTTTPTPALAHIVTTPALEGIVTWWCASYADELGLSPIELEILPPNEALAAAESGIVELVIAGLEPPPGWFATLLSIEGIAVVVHPSNPLRAFDMEDLAAIFAGKVTSWQELGGADKYIQPVIPLPGDEVRVRFEALVLDGLPPSPAARLGPTPLSTSMIVAEDPGAIGYLPFSQVTEEVRSVRVEGILPGPSTVQDGRYSLRLEILALAPQEPTGVAYELLAWLQSSKPTEKP